MTIPANRSEVCDARDADSISRHAHARAMVRLDESSTELPITPDEAEPADLTPKVRIGSEPSLFRERNELFAPSTPHPAARNLIPFVEPGLLVRFRAQFL